MSVKYSIKLASIDDVEGINNIVNYYIKNSGANWSWQPRTPHEAKEWFLSHDFDVHPIFVAKKEDGTILGYSSLSPFRSKKGYWPVAENSIYVNKNYHGMKIGKYLMKTLMEHAYSSKLEVVTAWIDSENKSRIDFHIKWGFELIGEMQNIGDKWDVRRSVTILQINTI